MNPFSAFFSVLASFFLEGDRAQEERAQAGPEGAAYSDALQRDSMAYYKRHGTYFGFDYDAFDAQFDTYYKAHATGDGFAYTEAGKWK
jgi:hypothetical protein